MDREIEANNLQSINFYSPDFSQFIELDRNNKQFVIKDTLTNQVVRLIPKELMTWNQKEKPLSVMNRFQWLDNTTFRIVNTEGIEKIVDYMNGFK